MNSVQLVGNIATDIQFREFDSVTQAGHRKAKASFLLAVSRPIKDSEPDWVRIETWNTLARNLIQFNRKGSRVGVSGHLRGEFYNPDGGDRGGELRTVVVADEIHYLSPPRALESAPVEAKPARSGR